ncbi:MAG: aminoacyl-histidine dipeptidase [Bacteroidales bacterium]
MKITELSPEILWKHFYDLTQVPRPSGHEQGAIEFLKTFAEKHNLEYHIDGTGNILIRKGAHPAKQSAKTVVLQSHVDMVPQKNSDKQHDFTRDAIETIIDGDWVKANKTTLGADNGIGVAATLAVLESSDIQHGPVEALFTISEETGMDGAFGLEAGFLKGDVLINLDSEDEGELFVGCAGGVDANVSWQYKYEPVNSSLAFHLGIKGLKGGHSGLDIHLGRGNANKLLSQLLLNLKKECDIRISDFHGGDLRNAIPREASAVIHIRDCNEEKLQTTVDRYRQVLIDQYKKAEPDLQIELKQAEPTDQVMPAYDFNKTMEAINTCPDGPINMSDFMSDVVQTSTNLAVVRIGDGKCEAQLLLRSSDDIEKKYLGREIKNHFKQVDAQTEFNGDYPGWQPDTNSKILSVAKDTYSKLFGKEPVVKVIHAGLECGIIGSKYSNLDMISIGPTIRHPHSPDEKVRIDTVEKFWDFLKALLEAV